MMSNIDKQILSDTENIDPVIHPIIKRDQPSFHLTSSKTLCCQQSHQDSVDEPSKHETQLLNCQPHAFCNHDSNFSLKQAIDSYRNLEQSESLLVWSEYFRCHRKTQQQTKDHKCEHCGKTCSLGRIKVRAKVKSAASAGVVLGINRSPDFRTYSRLRAKHRNESSTKTSIEQVLPYRTPNENDGAAIGV